MLRQRRLDLRRLNARGLTRRCSGRADRSALLGVLESRPSQVFSERSAGRRTPLNADPLGGQTEIAVALVQPPKPRGQFVDTPSGLELVVPAKRNILVTAFLGFWLCGWAFGEVMVVTQLRTGNAAGANLFLIAWLGAWTVGGGFAIYAFFWSLVGKERVLLSPGRISIRREILGFGRTSEYALGHVSKLRVAPHPHNPYDFRSGLQFWGVGGGLIAFDHGAATVRFAASVEESEAASIVERFEQRADFGESAT